MKAACTTSRGLTVSRSKWARFFTERRIMLSATRCTAGELHQASGCNVSSEGTTDSRSKHRSKWARSERCSVLSLVCCICCKRWWGLETTHACSAAVKLHM